jgi:hypothetical protein
VLEIEWESKKVEALGIYCIDNKGMITGGISTERLFRGMGMIMFCQHFPNVFLFFL